MSSLDRFVASRNFVATLSVDSKSRNGKSVTVIDGLPKNALFLDAMLKALKTKCGAGGTVEASGKEGRLIVQGDQREKIRAYLASENITFKG